MAALPTQVLVPGGANGRDRRRGHRHTRRRRIRRGEQRQHRRPHGEPGDAWHRRRAGRCGPCRHHSARRTTERWAYRHCFQQGDIAIARKKGSDKATIPCEFKLEKPATAVPFKAIFASPSRL
jgi:hypothetical protein